MRYGTVPDVRYASDDNTPSEVEISDFRCHISPNRHPAGALITYCQPAVIVIVDQFA